MNKTRKYNKKQDITYEAQIRILPDPGSQGCSEVVDGAVERAGNFGFRLAGCPAQRDGSDRVFALR